MCPAPALERSPRRLSITAPERQMKLARRRSLEPCSACAASSFTSELTLLRRFPCASASSLVRLTPRSSGACAETPRTSTSSVCVSKVRTSSAVCVLFTDMVEYGPRPRDHSWVMVRGSSTNMSSRRVSLRRTSRIRDFQRAPLWLAAFLAASDSPTGMEMPARSESMFPDTATRPAGAAMGSGEAPRWASDPYEVLRSPVDGVPDREPPRYCTAWFSALMASASADIGSLRTGGDGDRDIVIWLCCCCVCWASGGRPWGMAGGLGGGATAAAAAASSSSS
mmetsp:Transcript_52458/g.166831  ORF Transcript_52458/g.166831 Transcript_52458/m.166831 type:complete len:281 (+) Transcript_52458:2161-3003(+)